MHSFEAVAVAMLSEFRVSMIRECPVTSPATRSKARDEAPAINRSLWSRSPNMTTMVMATTEVVKRGQNAAGDEGEGPRQDGDEPIGRLVGGRLSENYFRSPLDNVCCCDYHRCHWEAAGMAA